MCNFLSAITLKDGSIRIGPTDSHSEIIDFHKIKETGIRGVQLVKLELVPEDLQDPISKWEFIVDQDLIPEWFDREKVEKRFRKMVKDSKIHTIYDEYLVKRRLIYDEYGAKMKTINDEYLAKWKPIDDEYDAKMKTIDDEYDAKRLEIANQVW